MPRLRGSVRQNFARRGRRKPQRRWPGILFRATAVAASIAIIGGLGTWLWMIEWPQKQADRLVQAYYNTTRGAGLAIAEVLVEGREATEKEELLRTLKIERGMPILAFDPAEALLKIQSLPWVADAVVERHLPDTIYIGIAERRPLARWQQDGTTHVIDAEGKVLPHADAAKFGNLPLVVGKGAPAATTELLDYLKEAPDVAKNVKAAVRVGERRWDLQLEPDVIVRLPEKNIDTALESLTEMIRTKNILARDIVAIDMRQLQRMVIETPSPVSPPTQQAAQPRI